MTFTNQKLTKMQDYKINNIGLECEVRKIGDDKHEFIASTGAVDRHGTVLDPNGWYLDSFRKNPVMAYQHDTHSSDPDAILGTWDVRIEDGKLIVVANYDTENEKAMKIKRKVDGGILKAVSVGFIPHEYRWGQKSKGENPDVMYLERNELLEVSIVAVPSNPEALKRSAEELMSKIEKPVDPVEDKPGLGNHKARLFLIKSKLNQ